MWAHFISYLQQHSAWLYGVSWCILLSGLIQNMTYLLQLPAAWLELRKHAQAKDTETSWQILISKVTLPISILMPAYNEALTIVANVQRMLALEYPDFEIIVINDGSSDETLRCLIEAFALTTINKCYELKALHVPIRNIYASAIYPRLRVIDKENARSKADAINAGINLSANPIICVVDADSFLESVSLLRAVRPFMEDPDTVAVGGAVRIMNERFFKNRQVKFNFGYVLQLLQNIEYSRVFLMARLAWSRWRLLTIISGAFGLFRRDVLTQVGGFSQNTVGEDYDVIIKLYRYQFEHKKNYRIRYIPEPVCWTEAPHDLKTLSRQRTRWQRGALEIFFKYKSMLCNPRYGRIGLIAFPYSLLVDVLGPLLEILGYISIPFLWLLNILSINFLLAFIAVFFIFGIFISTCTLAIEQIELGLSNQLEDLLILIWMAVIENFGYRQLNNIWRVMGWWQFLTKRKEWGNMTRKGYQNDFS